MITDIEATIREYLPNIIHMSLATCANEQPWVCEVHFAYDDQLNLYFRSLPNSRHSQELRACNKVAGNIVIQHQPDQKPRGVYFEGIAEELDNVTAQDIAFTTYRDRFHGDETMLTEDKKFYKVTVRKYFVFDAVESKPSQKYELQWKNN